MSSRLADLIEIEIAKPWYKTSSRELRHLYDARRETLRRAHAGLAVGLLCLFYSTCIVLDLILIPDVWRWSLLSRFVAAPMIGWTAFRYNWKGPIEIVEIRNAITIIIAACFWSIAMTATNNHIGALAYLSLSPMFVIAANIFCNLSLLVAASTSVVVFIMMSCIMLVKFDTEHYFVISNIAGIGWIAMLTLFVNWRSSRVDFRVFLHQMKSEIQQKIIEASNADLARLSSTDALTGLKNRRSADTALNDFLNEWTRTGAPFALMLLDVDFFKRYNDGYGHFAGDQCLIAIARSMQDVVMQHDGFIGRFGGEEFLVLARTKSLVDALSIADAVQSAVHSLALAHHHRADAIEIVTVSIGIALSDHADIAKAETLVKRADDALYQAKAAGRDRVVIFEPAAAKPEPIIQTDEITCERGAVQAA